VAYCAQHNNLFFVVGTDNSPGCFWDKEINSCRWLRHPASDMHTPIQRVLQAAVSSYFQEFFCTGWMKIIFSF